MCDIGMDESPPVRKTRRHGRSEGSSRAKPDEMLVGVAELSPESGGQPSRRLEKSDRKTSSHAAGHRHRSRSSSSRSGGGGSVLKKQNQSGSPPQTSVSKRDRAQNAQLADGEALFQRENTTLARQKLTSSASRVRPGKLQLTKPPTSGTTRYASQSPKQPDDEALRDFTSNNNSSDFSDDPVVEQTRMLGSRAVLSGHQCRGRAEWEVLYGVNQAGQLPTRSRHCLNQASGAMNASLLDSSDFPSTGGATEDSPLDNRPPSRQRHAFPTHLLDARELFSPTKQLDGAAQINITPWHAEEEEEFLSEASSPSIGPEEGEVEGTHKTGALSAQRPPSRYMVKATSRCGSSSSKASSSRGEDAQGRLPSRRGVAGSWNQAAIQHHHDPKTDGFLEVDESVPPPFRVEISTDPIYARYTDSELPQPTEGRRQKSKRASSFGARSHLHKIQQEQQPSLHDTTGQDAAVSGDMAPKRVSTRHSKIPIDTEWLGSDSEPAATRLSSDSTVRLARNSRSSHSIMQPTSTVHAPVDINSSATPTHHWFRSSSNPFFVSSAGVARASSFDDMDAETAIANTPLFVGEDDVLAMPPLTDLRLDDFLGDPCVSNAPSAAVKAVGGGLSATTGGVSVTASAAAGSAALNTSLGKDFLSLFAQH